MPLAGSPSRIRPPETGTTAPKFPAPENVPTRRAIAVSRPDSTLTVVPSGRGVDTIAAGGGWRSTSDRSRGATISEAIMKAILSMALVLGACGLAGAADEKAADPVGTWQCSYEIGEQKRTSTLTVKKEGDKLVGTMSWPNQKDEQLKDLKLKDGTLTFSAVRKLMDNEIPIDYKLTIDGDKLKGTGAAEVGGEKREFEIKGKREKKGK